MDREPIDNLIKRAHGSSPGAPASFKGRLHARMAAEATVQKQTRILYIKLAVSAAAVLILALVIGLNVDLFLPNKTTPPPPQAKDEKPEPANKPVQPAPQDNTQPVPEPKPEPQPEPKPGPKPDDTIEKPEPKPEPQPGPKPDDTVERPEPKPEPEPEPKPDDTVEKPEPKEPEPTDPNGGLAKRTYPEIGRLMTVGAETRVEGGPWYELQPGAAISAGMFLRAGRDNVDVLLDKGGAFRFDGELFVDGNAKGDGYVFQVIEDKLYVDMLGTGTTNYISHGELNGEFGASACFFEVEREGLNAGCIHGTLKLGGENVAPGKLRRMTSRGVQDEKEFKGDRLLKDLPARVLARYDFDEAPPGGMYGDGERLENGVAIMDKAPKYIAFRHDQTIEVLPGTVIRIRYRTTGVTRLELEQFTPDNETLFGNKWTPKNGEWQEIEIRTEEITEKNNPDRLLKAGELLRNFKLHYIGDKLEIDWVEFVRVQE